MENKGDIEMSMNFTQHKVIDDGFTHYVRTYRVSIMNGNGSLPVSFRVDNPCIEISNAEIMQCFNILWPNYA